jgi:argininosuccinate lyase
MQEDKEAVFDTFDTAVACLKITSTVLAGITVKEERVRAAAMSGYMNATEVADYLVRKGMPFREAHEVVGRVVVKAIELNVELQELELAEFRGISEVFDADVYNVVSLEATLRAKGAIGGTSPEQVQKALEHARQSLP